jgi:Ser/Thr protein kinase RdoA (MazF antagonist)
MVGEQLGGGNMNAVQRVGDTVVRISGPWTANVHRYLHTLAAAGIEGIPTPLAIDGQTETLTYVDGIVPHYPLPAWVFTDSALRQAATTLRAMHDASVPLIHADGTWQSATHEPVEVICHNDFSPHNLAFVEGRVVGVIDFDMASPGPRIWDLAYLATRMVPLTSELPADAPGEDRWVRRIRLMLEAYGRVASAPIGVLDVVRMAVVRLRDLATFTEAKAAELGKPVLLEHAALYRRDAAYLDSWGDVGHA